MFGRAIHDHPALGLIKRRTDFTGLVAGISVKYANASSRGVTFTTAQTNANLPKAAEFALTRAKDYAVLTLQPEELYASQSKDGAYATAFKTAMDSISDSMGESWAHQFMAPLGAYGTLGRGSTYDTATGIITLADPNEATNFDVGMVLGAVTDPTSGAGTVRAGTGTVTKVSESAGTVTVTPINPSGWANGANTDYYYINGDLPTVGTASKMQGFFAWNPVTLPSPDSFFGVDRSVARERLAGHVFNASGYRVDEALKNGVLLASRAKQKLTDIVLNHEMYQRLLNTLEHKERANFDLTLREGRFTTKIGYEGVKLYCAAGAVNVWADAAMGTNYAAGFDRDAWTLFTLGTPGRMIELDGHSMQWSASADTFEFRFITLGNFYCSNPGSNVTWYNLGA